MGWGGWWVGGPSGAKEPGLGLRGVVGPHMLSGSGSSHLACTTHNSFSCPVFPGQEFSPTPRYLVGDRAFSTGEAALRGATVLELGDQSRTDACPGQRSTPCWNHRPTLGTPRQARGTILAGMRHNAGHRAGPRPGRRSRWQKRFMSPQPDPAPAQPSSPCPA